MLASIDIAKLLACRRISYLISKDYARKYSSQYVNETHTHQLFCYHSKKFLLTQKRHVVFRTSEFHSLSRSSSAVLRKVQKMCTSLSCNYQTKSNDFNKDDDDNSEMESKGRNVLDDLEFESILKDFSKDFGVSDETRPFLEEIKQQHGSFEEDAEKSTDTSNKLDSTNDSELRTTRCSTVTNSQLHELSGQDSSSIQDFEETGDDSEDFFHIDQELEEKAEYDDKRGKTGVYDVDELVTVLRKENLTDICAIQVPVSFHYADYLVLATAKSPRHCHAIMELIIKLYKKKKNKKDPFVKCEGKTTATWKALDMGNIILHIFLGDTRDFYDIESFWLLDKKYDKIDSHKSDPHLDMMQQHLDFLNSLGPN